MLSAFGNDTKTVTLWDVKPKQSAEKHKDGLG